VNTIPNDRAAELAAAAYAARRAARPAWRNAHSDRLAREVEARRIAKEYRQAQRLAARSVTTKQCSACGESLPLDSFSPAHRDRATARCKPCSAAVTRKRYHGDLEKARSRTRNRPVDPERQRKAAERQRKAAEDRERKAAERQRKVTERERKAAERIAHLAALLSGAVVSGQRISSAGGWDMADAELRKLWARSGDKQCVSCNAVVPPSAMLPPGPANFYPGHCRSCATAACNANTLRVTGKPPPGPRLIPMKDGTAITIAEFACRVRERSLGHRA
jgi:hypothetical protein